jgi:hypothetical protein
MSCWLMANDSRSSDLTSVGLRLSDKIDARADLLIAEQEAALLFQEFAEAALQDLQETCGLTA